MGPFFFLGGGIKFHANIWCKVWVGVVLVMTRVERRRKKPSPRTNNWGYRKKNCQISNQSNQFVESFFFLNISTYKIFSPILYEFVNIHPFLLRICTYNKKVLQTKKIEISRILDPCLLARTGWVLHHRGFSG